MLSKLTGDLTYNQLVEVTMDKSSSSDTQVQNRDGDTGTWDIGNNDMIS